MDNSVQRKAISVENKFEELERINRFIEQLEPDWTLPPALIFSLTLVMEEALSNIITYGFKDEGSHKIDVSFYKINEEILISIEDDGEAYDPTLKPDPDITLSAEERPIGGLGIFLIKKIMDKVEYRRKNDRNILELTKKI